MTKKELEEYAELGNEMEILKMQIIELEPEIVSDTANDYSTGYPHSISLHGIGWGEYDKQIERLGDRLKRVAKEDQEKREQVEEWIATLPNAGDRNIIRLYYIERMKLKEIGLKLGYTESMISRRLKKIFDQT